MTSTTMMSSATAASNHPSIAAALVDAHPRLRKNAGKCTLSLVGRNSPDYMHQCEEAVFDDYDDWEDEEEEEGRKCFFCSLDTVRLPRSVVHEHSNISQHKCGKWEFRISKFMSKK